jgi:WD40 repeat protein/serine/threonine protein kinase
MVRIACPSQAELAALSSGHLSRDRLEAVSDHLDSCADCSAALKAYDASRIAAASLPPLGRGHVAPKSVGVYEILSVLGRGGMGTVYKARHTLLKRDVALKVLPAELWNDSMAVARFRREMEAVGLLDHPNIVHAHDAGEADGVHFLVMEYVAGIDLDRLVRRKGPLPVEIACSLIRQAARGLQHAHEHGLVHRDIKPSNLLVARNGQLKLLDLGLALLRGEPAAGEGLTQTGQMMGTVDYMAPEQAFDTHRVDIHADLYSLGCTLYHLLAGHPPYHGPGYQSAMRKLLAHAQEPAPPIQELRPDVPMALAAVLDRLLAKAPADRYATPAELVAALKPFSAGLSSTEPAGPAGVKDPGGELGPTLPEPPTVEPKPEPFVVDLDEPELLPEESAPRWPPRRRVLIGVAAGLLGLGGLLLLLPIIVKVKDKDGKAVVRVQVPPGGSVEIEEDRAPIAVEPAQPKAVPPVEDAAKHEPPPAPPSAPLAAPALPLPAPLLAEPAAATVHPSPPELPDDGAMSRTALVHRPAKIAGLENWTLETIGHRGMILSVAWGPDDRWLATGGEDGAVRIWDTSTGRLARALVGHSHGVRSVAFSPDGSLLASSGKDGTARLWETRSGKLRRIFRHDPLPMTIMAVAWSPDGETLATGGNMPVHLWDVASGQKLKTVDFGNPAAFLAWSRDGKYLAAASGRVVIWQVDGSQAPRTLEAPELDDYNLAWSPDSKTLASGDYNGVVHLFNASTGQLRGVLEKPENLGIAMVAWSPNGKALATGHQDGSVRLWDAATTQPIDTFERKADGHVTSLAWSRNGRGLAGSGGPTARLWNTMTGQEMLVMPGHPACDPTTGIESIDYRPVAWSPDGAILAFPSQYSVVKTWWADSGRLLHAMNVNGSHPGRLAFAPDGKTLAAQIGPSLWDVASGQPTELSPSAYNKSAVAWSPDGRLLACADTEGEVQLWSIDSGQVARTARGRPGYARAVGFSPDGRVLAAAGWDDCQVRLWDARSGAPLRSTQGRPDTNNADTALAWSADGKTLATGSYYGQVRTFDAATGRWLVTMNGHSAPIQSLGWSPDGRTLTSRDGQGVVRTWNPESGELQATLRWPGAGTVSSDGRQVASVLGNVLRTWDAATGEPHGTLVALADDQVLVVSPEGHFTGTPRVERQVVYVVQTEAGQEIFSPEAFAAKFGWRNDTKRAALSSSNRPQ